VRTRRGLVLTAVLVIAAGSGGEGQTTPRVRRHLQRGARLVQPTDLVYVGAIRLPDRDDGAPVEASFEYAGQAMAYRANGDPGGPADGFPGSLLLSGFDVENRIAEIDIPVPVVSPGKHPEDLPVARVLQPFRDVRGSLFTAFTEIPRVALLCLGPTPVGEKVIAAWGQHFQDDPALVLPSHAWLDPAPLGANLAGAWWVGEQSLYSVNGYLLEIPPAWAEAHTGGRRVGTGRARDGGWSGRGPALFAIAPWLSGNPPPPGTRLAEVPLLLYSHTRSDPPDPTSTRLAGYQEPDEWEGGAWLGTADGRAAVAFVGTKATGALYWYGWVNPAGPDIPCVETVGTGMLGCYRADGSPCPPELVRECAGHTSERGWWSASMEAQIILYDPVDLAAVAAGTLAPGAPQPYATLAIDDRLFLPDPTVEPDALGPGRQRRYRLGESAYDRERSLLYVLERFADAAKPVIHVWQVR